MKQSIFTSTLTILLVYGIFYLLDYRIIDTNESTARMVESLEYSYFEGQKDALNNDIRIEKVNDSCWVWVESPWDGMLLSDVKFNPCNNKYPKWLTDEE